MRGYSLLPGNGRADHGMGRQQVGVRICQSTASTAASLTSGDHSVRPIFPSQLVLFPVDVSYISVPITRFSTKRRNLHSLQKTTPATINFVASPLPPSSPLSPRINALFVDRSAIGPSECLARNREQTLFVCPRMRDLCVD